MGMFRLSAPAEAQINDILAHSQEKFGEITRQRYAALIVRAMLDVSVEQMPRTVIWKKTRAGNIGIYHIRDNRNNVSDPPGRVAEPRHYLIFRAAEDGITDILGFIHDSMLFNRALGRITRQNRDDIQR